MAKRHMEAVSAIKNFGLIDDHTGVEFHDMSLVAGVYETSRNVKGHPELGGSMCIALKNVPYYSINEIYVDHDGHAHVSTYGCATMYPEWMNDDPLLAMNNYNVERGRYESEVGLRAMKLVAFYSL